MPLYVADYSLFAPNFRHFNRDLIPYLKPTSRGWQRYTLLHFIPDSLTKVRAITAAQTILHLHIRNHVSTDTGET